MKPIHYRPFKLAVTALLMGTSAIFMLADSDPSVLGMVFGLVMGVGALGAGACGIDQRPALALEGQSLAVRTTLRRRVVALSDILTVSVETRMVRLFGLIPIARREFLVIRVQGGMIGSQKFRIAGGMLALPPGGLGEVRAMLNTLRGTGSVGAALSTNRSTQQANDGASGFDPDAAIARYLAQKAAMPEPTLAPPAAPQPPGPARATFGRRVA